MGEIATFHCIIFGSYCMKIRIMRGRERQWTKPTYVNAVINKHLQSIG